MANSTTTTLADQSSPIDLVNELETAAVTTEREAARRGWGSGDGESCVFPAGRLVDTLLDLRAVVRDVDNASLIVDRALDDHARRPGASTTAEVKALCAALRSALG